VADKDDINKLTDLKTARVSLVHRGANRRKFSIRKAEVEMNEETLEQHVEIMKSTEAGAEKGLDASEIKKALSEKAMNALKGAMRLVNAFAEEAGMKNVLAAMEAATKMAPGEEYPKPKAAEKQNGKPEDEKDKYPGPAKMAKALDGMTPEQQKRVEEAIQKSHDAAQERIAKAEKDAEEIKKAFEAERDLRLTREFIAKAASDYKAMPGKPEELGVLLKDTHATSGKLGERWEGVVKSASAMLEKSALLGEMGRTGEKDTAAGAAGELDKLSSVQK